MKRLLLLAGAFALAVPVPLALPGPAAAESRAWVSQFCREDVPNNPPAVVGDCVSLINTLISDSGGLVRHSCSIIQMFFPDDFYASYDSLSECIRDGGSELPPLPD